MSSFTNPPVLTKIGAQRWRVDVGFVYHIGRVDSGFFVAIESGYETDLTSVPKCFKWALKPDGQYAHAAIVHDWMYDRAIASKAHADLTFYEAMEVLKVPQPLRWLMYQAVRWFGRGSYPRLNQFKKEA